MKERGIIFSAPMVRATWKTMTRRVMKPQPALAPGIGEIFRGSDDIAEWPASCPYGVPGDRLYVKEAWRVGAWDEDEGDISVDYKADNSAREEWLKVPDEAMFNRLWEESSLEAEKAGAKHDEDGYHWKPGQSPTRWRSSRFMPRWASRILLEIADVRAERLQDITEEDAKAEGVESLSAFIALWESIYGPGAWDENPWVWAITFRRM